MDTGETIQATEAQDDVHHKLGQLTRQLHNTLRELGLADKLQHTAQELPDAKSRLSYIARLTGEAAEKVLNRVDQAKNLQDSIASETRDTMALLVKNPVAAVASGRVMNYLSEIELKNQEMDQHLTEIMMAQDFHDLTGQVIKRVVTLATDLEDQLVQLLIQTAPPGSALAGGTGKPAAPAEDPMNPRLDGPVVNPQGNTEVVTDQSQVDDLLASLGF